MTRKWSDEAANLAQSLWDQTFRHPFLLELLDGTLPTEKMRFYIEQDFLYIQGCVVDGQHAAAKAPDSEARSVALARVLKFNEGRHIRRLLKLVNGDEAIRPAPACHAYMQHLRSIALSRSTVEYLAAYVACPWTGALIGRMLRGHVKQPLHAAWWESSGEGSDAKRTDSVGEYLAVIDRLAQDVSEETWKEMLENFIISTRYEYWFWSMGYTLETWEQHDQRVTQGLMSHIQSPVPLGLGTG